MNTRQAKKFAKKHNLIPCFNWGVIGGGHVAYCGASRSGMIIIKKNNKFSVMNSKLF